MSWWLYSTPQKQDAPLTSKQEVGSLTSKDPAPIPDQSLGEAAWIAYGESTGAGYDWWEIGSKRQAAWEAAANAAVDLYEDRKYNTPMD